MDAVLSFRPFKAVARPSPGLDVIARCVEHDHRRRGLTRVRWLKRPRPVQDPDIVFRIDRNARGISELPLGRHLRPRVIHLEDRQTASLGLSGLSRKYDCRRDGQRN